jgi:VWFA-related protein
MHIQLWLSRQLFPVLIRLSTQSVQANSMPISTFVPVLVAASAVAWPCLAAAAQQPAVEKPVTGLSAHQVQFTLIVRDKRGTPVTNLTAGDLALTDNSRPQNIQVLAAESKVPLKLGLLVDTGRGMTRAMDSERKAAEKFVDLMLPANPSGAQPANQAFLIHFDREVELLEDFTGSSDKLKNDLEQLGPTRPTENNQGPETTDSEGGYGGQHNLRNASPQLYDAIYLATDDLMKSKQGGKALVVFCNGVDRGSKKSLNEAIEAAESAYTPVYTIYFRGDEQRAEGGYPGGRRHGGMGGGWPGSGGGWPGGYPGGGSGRGGGTRQPQVDGKRIMEQIATRTGGLYFEAKKTADLDDIYSEIARNILGQYLLSYTPDHSSDDTDYHKIVVKTNKSDLTVTAPEGYYTGDRQSN